MAEDVLVASFYSPYRHGEVWLWYCPHEESYRCVYKIAEGGKRLGAQFCVSAALYGEVAAMVMDAMDVARTPLDRRS